LTGIGQYYDSINESVMAAAILSHLQVPNRSPLPTHASGAIIVVTDLVTEKEAPHELRRY